MRAKLISLVIGCAGAATLGGCSFYGEEDYGHHHYYHERDVVAAPAGYYYGPTYYRPVYHDDWRWRRSHDWERQRRWEEHRRDEHWRDFH